MLNYCIIMLSSMFFCDGCIGIDGASGEVLQCGDEFTFLSICILLLMG